jgi:enamine deaminase RidA (YjgF/YER057c/UK114 family)
MLERLFARLESEFRQPAVAREDPMSIKRSTPEVGYINSSVFQQLNVSQTVRANNMVYFSGIVAATGNGEVVEKGDAAGQVKFVLMVLERLLQAEQLSFANLVAVTVYAPDLEAILGQLGLFAQVFAAHPPTFQAIGVKNLASPEYMLELVAVAAGTLPG